MSIHLTYSRDCQFHDLTLQEVQEPKNNSKNVITLSQRLYILHGDHEEAKYLITRIHELKSPQGISGEAFQAKLLQLDGIDKTTLSCPLFETAQKIVGVASAPASSTLTPTKIEETKAHMSELWKHSILDKLRSLCERYLEKRSTYQDAARDLANLAQEIGMHAKDLNISITIHRETWFSQLTESNFQETYLKLAEQLIKDFSDSCTQEVDRFMKRQSELLQRLTRDYLEALQNRFPTEGVETLRKNLQVEVVKCYMNLVAEHKHFSGVALIVEKGEALLHQGYGMASDHMKNQLDTVFHVASVTKQFTAAAIMLLREAGKIDLKTGTNRYLPEKYRCANWEFVTVHHLLSHTGGVVDYTEMTNWCDTSNGFLFGERENEAIHASQSTPLEFEPGNQMRYTNLGYTLLGTIIEQVSGQSYSEFIQDKILNPMGMFSSGIHRHDYAAKDGHAAGHRWDGEKLVDDNKNSLAVTASDGGLFTTTADLLKWSYMISGKVEGVLKPESIKLMTTPTEVSKSTPLGGYGYGLGVDDSSGTRRIHHPGWIPGFRSSFCLYPEKDLHIVLLCNNTHAIPEQISKGIEEILFGIEGLVINQYYK